MTVSYINYTLIFHVYDIKLYFIYILQNLLSIYKSHGWITFLYDICDKAKSTVNVSLYAILKVLWLVDKKDYNFEIFMRLFYTSKSMKTH